MRTVGAVIFEGFEVLDLYGPLEMFGMCEDAFEIRLVAESEAPVASRQGPRALPDRTFGAPCDILLVPGGPGTRREVGNAALLGAIRDAAAGAGIVASVCTGSALLARAGLLDGRRATSNKRAFDWVRAQGPDVLWQRRARWVADGRFWTSSGVSAGIDMSLALIAGLLGEEAAEAAADRAEYRRHPDPDDDPFEAGERP